MTFTRAEITRRFRERHKERLKLRPYPSQSKEMTREYQRRYRARHHERVRALENARRNTPEGTAKQRAYYTKCSTKPAHRMQRLITKARRRAADKGLDVSDALFAALKANPPTYCECCGKAFDYALNKGHNKCSASFDRIDNTQGYVEGNVAAICRRCNRLKGDATLEEIEAIAAYMRRHMKAAKCA